MDHSFTIDKSFTAEASVQYQSPMQYGIFKIESQTVFNAGLRNMNLNFIEKGESQVARLTLTYRFGNNEIKAARRRSTGLEEETNRMKN